METHVGWRSRDPMMGIDPRCVQALAEAETCADVIGLARVPADHTNLSSYLFAILMGTLTGEAQETLLGLLEMNGYEAWRVLAANAKKRERRQVDDHVVAHAAATWRCFDLEASLASMGT